MDTSMASTRRLALILRGESFRAPRGMGLGERELKGHGSDYESQQKASKSHVDFIIRPWEDCGFTVDVFISSYVVGNATKALPDWYGGRVVDADFVDQNAAGQGQGARYMNGLEMLYKRSSKKGILYEAMIITRPDVIFKSMPMPPGAHWNKTMFLFHEWEFCGGRKGIADQAALDTFLYVPWNHFDCAYAVGFGEHGTFNSFKGLFRSHMPHARIENYLGFIFPNEWHDTNSAGDWNPVYNLVRKAQSSDIHGHVAAPLVGARKHDVFCLACVQSLLENAHRQGNPKNDFVDWYIHSWSPSLNKIYAEHLRDRFANFHFQELSTISDPLREGFPAWGRSVMLAFQAIRKQEVKSGPPEYCTRPAVDYELVIAFRDDAVLRCHHNVAWYQDKIPICQGWKRDCTEEGAVVGLGFGSSVALKFPAVPSVLVTNSYGARSIASRLASFRGSIVPWPRDDASEAEVLRWFKEQFGMPVLQVCREC